VQRRRHECEKEGEDKSEMEMFELGAMRTGFVVMNSWRRGTRKGWKTAAVLRYQVGWERIRGLTSLGTE